MSKCKNSELKISGVKVFFPYAPYPCQIAYMEKIIKSLQNKKYAILESPTGTGKTLSLLCATLAWQRDMKYSDEDFIKSQPSTQNIIQPLINIDKNSINLSDEWLSKSSKYFNYQPHKIRKMDIKYDDLSPEKINNSKYENGNQYIKDLLMKTTQMSSNKKSINRIPKIIYSTRTHKQINQIISELRKTSYNNIKMTILSSRDFTCVHPEVAKQRDKNDRCINLIKGFHVGCQYYKNLLRPKRQAEVFDFAAQNPVWDIEELTRFGRKNWLCPYFATRSLIEDSDIIFCPYNYILDKGVRNSIPSLNLKNQILIFDEAHNIEDVARESASLTWEHESIYQVCEFLRDVRWKDCEKECQLLASTLRTVYEWMSDMKDHLDEDVESAKEMGSGEKWREVPFIDKKNERNFDSAAQSYSGQPMLAVLNHINIGPETFSTIMSSFAKIKEQTEKKAPASAEPEPMQNDETKNLEEYGNDDAIGGGEPKYLKLFENLIITLQYLYKDHMKYFEDYRLVLSKEMLPLRMNKNRAKTTANWLYTFNLWCMNPAVAMSDLVPNVHSIIITSGTLSPIHSFTTELGLAFDYTYEACHVIPAERIWIRSLGSTLTGKSLKVVYKACQSLVFQDELGQLLLRIFEGTLDHSKMTQGGILCFFPSYALLDKLIDRWKNTGLWTELTKVKSIFVEPRDTFSDLVSDTNDNNSDMKIDGYMHTGQKSSGSYRNLKASPQSLDSILNKYAVSCGLDSFPGSAKIGVIYPPEEDRAKKRRRRKRLPWDNDELSCNQKINFEPKAAVQGGVLLAVYRGKVSEGIDFADHLARLVISIGLPYPNVREKKVVLKRKYNDGLSHSTRLTNGRGENSNRSLTGSEWLEIQAFRALNQALGRCLRHKDDWGALLLLDERFANQNSYSLNNAAHISSQSPCQRQNLQTHNLHAQKLSRWVRDNLKNCSSSSNSECSFVIDDLSTFLAKMSTNSSSNHYKNNEDKVGASFPIVDVPGNYVLNHTEDDTDVIIDLTLNEKDLCCKMENYEGMECERFIRSVSVNRFIKKENSPDIIVETEETDTDNPLVRIEDNTVIKCLFCENVIVSDYNQDILTTFDLECFVNFVRNNDSLFANDDHLFRLVSNDRLKCPLFNYPGSDSSTTGVTTNSFYCTESRQLFVFLCCAICDDNRMSSQKSPIGPIVSSSDVIIGFKVLTSLHDKDKEQIYLFPSKTKAKSEFLQNYK
ncbi:Fanconi anemia group J protein-like [Gordionus sp. m RMFG-2023]|uniref:Fanconi anemia group J protein-like n=1 Tax=Gordionus sp. m RMFG-2023 TaxID=3053472 RepID=UPI0031FCA01A